MLTRTQADKVRANRAAADFIKDWKSVIRRFYENELSPAELQSWQDARLRSVLRHVTDNAPFYGARLAGHSIENTGLDDLDALPFTTKKDLGEAMYNLISGDIRDSLHFFCTTGTTGPSSPCPRSRLDFEVDNEPISLSLGRMLENWLPEGEKPVLAMLCPNETHSVCLSISAAAQELDIFKFDAFPLSPVIGFERLFDLLLELKANTLICSPGLVMALAEMSQAYGVNVESDLHVRCILTTGELCTPNMARLIEATWNARCCNWWYGSQEAGTSALAEPDGLLVPVATNHIVEVLDLQTGVARRDQGRGELCLTTLIPGMKPLVRYRTGDLVELSMDLNGRQTMRILGRIKDQLELNGETRTAAEIEASILGDHGLIYGYHLEVSEESGEDRLLVRVKLKPSSEFEVVKALVSARVSQDLAVKCEVESVPLLDLVTATGGWVSWKTARTKDLRAETASTIETQSATNLVSAAVARI